MDDARIKQLESDVLAKLADAPDPQAGDLEARVATLERAVRGLQAASGPAATLLVARAEVPLHPSFQLLDVSGGGEGQCVLEPDKPCVESGRCRALGH